ncbi:hypothetical protein MQE23_00345 [Streptomyces sp. HP-A2021]|uniref:hypothetical protein n=1 Tax=Streptomyces sp. HP-A2021 TaxID=2927875 RepID=UPI001FAF057D|nr:hypothetical protein [Streptomyces sp. HP-A2021]UOB07634.1 hypothetical protein MQE23_00345 [Streptomyces sp. HP-A2021]
MNGTKASGSASCIGKCKVAKKSFPGQTISKSAEPYGQFFMDTTINTGASKQRGTGRSVASWTFSNREWVAPSEPTKLSTVEVRCDNALPGAPRQIGCITLQAVPVISYSQTGPWPEVAKHIKDAQATGLPGKYGTTNFLTSWRPASVNCACEVLLRASESLVRACSPLLDRPLRRRINLLRNAHIGQGESGGVTLCLAGVRRPRVPWHR